MFVHNSPLSGNFADVKRARNRATNEIWAIKFIDKNKFAMSQTSSRANALTGEAEILRSLNHPGVSIYSIYSHLYVVHQYQGDFRKR